MKNKLLLLFIIGVFIYIPSCKDLPTEIIDETPVIEIVYPREGQQFIDTVNVITKLDSNIVLKKIELYANDLLYSKRIIKPYNFVYTSNSNIDCSQTHIYVKAETFDGKVLISPKVSVCAYKTLPPTNINVRSIDEHSFELNWESQSQNIDSTVIEIYKSQIGSYYRYAAVEDSTSSFVMTYANISSYKFRLKSYFNGISSEYSREIELRYLFSVEQTDRQILPFKEIKHSVSSNIGSYLLLADITGTVSLLNLETISIEKTINTNQTEISEIQFYPNSIDKFAYSYSNQVKIAEFSSGNIISGFSAENPIKDFDFSPNGKLYAQIDSAYNLEIIDLENNQTVFSEDYESERNCGISFNKDNEYLAILLNTSIKIIKPSDFKTAYDGSLDIYFSPNGIQFSPFSNYIYLQTYDYIYDFDGSTLNKINSHLPNNSSSFAFLPGEYFVASTYYNSLFGMININNSSEYIYAPYENLLEHTERINFNKNIDKIISFSRINDSSEILIKLWQINYDRKWLVF